MYTPKPIKKYVFYLFSVSVAIIEKCSRKQCKESGFGLRPRVFFITSNLKKRFTDEKN